MHKIVHIDDIKHEGTTTVKLYMKLHEDTFNTRKEPNPATFQDHRGRHIDSRSRCSEVDRAGQGPGTGGASHKSGKLRADRSEMIQHFLLL